MRFKINNKEFHLNEWHLSAILATPLLLLYLYVKFGSSYYYVDLPAGNGVPPDPGRWTNNSTLLGIDSDNDGVRDDVQRYILHKYKGNKRAQNLLMHNARFIQDTLELPESRRTVINFFTKKNSEHDCVLYMNGYLVTSKNQPEINENLDFPYLGTVAHRLVLNTYKRRAEYKKKNLLGSGTVYLKTPNRDINPNDCFRKYGIEAVNND